MYAPGLPDKSKTDPIHVSGNTRLVFQRHKATADHFDMRLQEGGIAHSWVTRSLPGEKDKFLAIRQPTHTAEYMGFEGEIPSGYGAGTVKKVYDEPAEIIHSSNDRIKMVIPEGEFTMLKLKGDKDWLVVKNKNTIKDPVTSKHNIKIVAEPDLDPNDLTKVWQPKVDGGHTVFRLNSDSINRIYSYRTSKRTGKPIEHTHQVPELRDSDVPKSLDGTELRGELYAKGRDRKPLPAHEIGGMLNADVFKSRETQGTKGKLIPYIFDIVKYKGENVADKPYADKLKMIKDVETKVPLFRVAETALNPDEKREMFNQIKTRKHPDTVEGLVQWDLTVPGGAPKKLKLRDTHDVYVREIFPAEASRPIAGGFTYSWTPEGSIVGRVGTGFSEKMRREMLKDPKKFIGRVARIKTQQVFESGAARAPAFYTMDVEKNLEKNAATMEQLQKAFNKSVLPYIKGDIPLRWKVLGSIKGQRYPGGLNIPSGYNSYGLFRKIFPIKSGIYLDKQFIPESKNLIGLHEKSEMISSKKNPDIKILFDDSHASPSVIAKDLRTAIGVSRDDPQNIDIVQNHLFPLRKGFNTIEKLTGHSLNELKYNRRMRKFIDQKWFNMSLEQKKNLQKTSAINIVATWQNT